MTRKIIALLGRRDTPTDAVEEYCCYLHEALREQGFDSELVRVPWDGSGWGAALKKLEVQAKAWPGCWIFVQYTALAWSKRGFPTRLLRVLNVLREARTHVAIVYHDVLPFAGQRFVDRVRRLTQVYVMNKAMSLAELGIFTIPTTKISWVSKETANVTFIPVGANLPERTTRELHVQHKNDMPTIAVYGITGGEAGIAEIANISDALAATAKLLGRLRLVVFGRNSRESEAKLVSVLDRQLIETEVLGLLPAGEISRQLLACDVLLFVRGGISSRRGSAIAGIACGLPIVAFAGDETASPITEAGIVFAKPARGGLGEALLRVLGDAPYRRHLAERSLHAQEMYFSWKAIANRYTEEIRLAEHARRDNLPYSESEQSG